MWREEVTLDESMPSPQPSFTHRGICLIHSDHKTKKVFALLLLCEGGKRKVFMDEVPPHITRGHTDSARSSFGGDAERIV